MTPDRYDRLSNTVALGQTGDDRIREGRAIVNAPHALVSDQDTEADMAAGKAPSYALVLTDRNGQRHAISGPDGRLKRIYFDPAPAQDAALERSLASQRQWQELMSTPQALGPM